MVCQALQISAFDLYHVRGPPILTEIPMGIWRKLSFVRTLSSSGDPSDAGREQVKRRSPPLAKLDPADARRACPITNHAKDLDKVKNCVEMTSSCRILQSFCLREMRRVLAGLLL